MLTLLTKYPNKIFKTFMIEDFFHLPPMSTTMVVHLDMRNGPIVTLRGLGETDSWKNLKSKIAWHCPFNPTFHIIWLDSQALTL
jgi:hypothetical protein